MAVILRKQAHTTRNERSEFVESGSAKRDIELTSPWYLTEKPYSMQTVCNIYVRIHAEDMYSPI
jgi:hypothetical protein